MRRTKRPRSWSCSVGERGRNRVRVFENRHGTLYAEFYEPTPEGLKPKRISLRHRDRDRAIRQAYQIAAQFAVGERTETQDPTLGTLFDSYVREVTRRKGSSSQLHDRRVKRMLSRRLDATGVRVRSTHATWLGSSSSGAAARWARRDPWAAAPSSTTARSCSPS
jgi:hypothetical protein